MPCCGSERRPRHGQESPLRSSKRAAHDQCGTRAARFDTETPAPIAQAARQIVDWRTAGLDVHTFRDASFPLRNATMSGYGRATIVVEAGEASGARIQARVGVEHGRTVILRDSVVRANEWAAALQRRPGVHVVSGVDETLGVVAALHPALDDVLSSALALER